MVGAVACPARGRLDVALEIREVYGLICSVPQPLEAILPGTQPSTTTVSPKELTEAVDQAIEELVEAQAGEIQYYLDE